MVAASLYCPCSTLICLAGFWMKPSSRRAIVVRRMIETPTLRSLTRVIARYVLLERSTGWWYKGASETVPTKRCVTLSAMTLERPLISSGILLPTVQAQPWRQNIYFIPPIWGQFGLSEVQNFISSFLSAKKVYSPRQVSAPDSCPIARHRFKRLQESIAA